MRILIVGSGGREHAIARAFAGADGVEKVFAFPGREGFEGDAVQVAGEGLSPEAILGAAREIQVDLTVIGPEVPLVEGVADLFECEKMPVFGPVRGAARLEGSKEFSKVVLTEAGIPTARYVSIRKMDDLEGAIRAIGLPAAIKADGLAAGKGVVLVREAGEAREAARRFLLEGELGDAGRTVVFEELLEGEELSLFAIVSGERYALFPTARDYKRIGEGGTGPNTGGMGAIVPVPGYGAAAAASLAEMVFPPLLAELCRRGVEYRGILYAGLMLTADGPKVLEFNCRLGDPEAQALLPHIDEDLHLRMAAVAGGGWIDGPVRMKEGASVCVVLASKGYPGKGVHGDVITGIDEAGADGVVLFHAGTCRQENEWVTAGGRVLNVVASGRDLEEARARAYEGAKKIRFAGAQIRPDIGLPGVRG